MNMTNATNQMGSATNGVATGVAPNFAKPSQGLNDDWLLDDSVEQKEEQIHIPAFKTSALGEIPEENPNVDLIAASDELDEQVTMPLNAAVEELEISLRDLSLLRETISINKGMNAKIALECNDLMPGFIDDDVRPMGYFTVNTSKTMLKEALEEIDKEENKVKSGMLAKFKERIEKFLRWLKSIVEKVMGRFSSKKKTVFESNQDISEAAKEKPKKEVPPDGEALVQKHISAFLATVRDKLPSRALEDIEGSNKASLGIAIINKWPRGEFIKDCTDMYRTYTLRGRDLLEDPREVRMGLEKALEELKSVSSERVTEVAVKKYIEAIEKNTKTFDILSDTAKDFFAAVADFVKIVQTPGHDFAESTKVVVASVDLSSQMSSYLSAIGSADFSITNAYNKIRKEASDAFKEEVQSGNYENSHQLFTRFLDVIYARDSAFDPKMD